LPVDARQVTAFRLERSGLLRRTRDVEKAVGELGLPDFPPGAALAALAPRLDGASPATLADAFERRALVRLRAMRGAPVVARRSDFEALAAGVLPPDESSMRAFVRPALASVQAAKLPALAAVEMVTAACDAALAKGPLDRDALHAELRRRLPKGLLPYCRPCDSHHVHPALLYAVALRAPWVLFPQDDGPYVIARADRWLAEKRQARRAEAPKSDAPAELLRGFLRAYGRPYGSPPRRPRRRRPRAGAEEEGRARDRPPADPPTRPPPPCGRRARGLAATRGVPISAVVRR
jgi:hypothetical protein